MTCFPPSSHAIFADAYPQSPAILSHDLVDHPLLSLSALADAARALPGHHVERRVADAVNGGDFAMARPDDGSVADAIASGATSDSWVMLRFVEQLPAYRDLLGDLLAELEPMVAAAGLKGFVFISAPGTLTPLHFDAEYNILFQIAGDKSFATYPPGPPFVTLDRREAYHRSGDNMLPWQDGYEALATVHRLTPGAALFVPHGVPHWVRVGTEPSISLSLTWQDDWSHSVADALAFNPLLRRCGVSVGDVPAWPDRPVWRARGARAARRLRLL